MPRLVALLFASPLLLLAIGASVAQAAGAPQAALDKTVTMSWTTSGTGVGPNGPISYSNTNIRTVYISSAGRTFLRMQVSGHWATRTGDRGPDEGSSRGSVHFEGNQLVGVETFLSGARRYTATFDSGFSSCTVNVIDAKSGSANIKRRGPDGAMYDITSASTGAMSCAIQSGNAFGGQ